MATKSEMVNIPAGKQTFKGYLALPEGAPRGAVVVIQEIFGVNHHIRSVADRVAQSGYVALAPDLFWRVQPGIELGYTPDDIAKGREVRGKLNTDDAVADVGSAMQVLAARPEAKGKKIGVIGFCWGGQVTYLAACRLKPAAAAAYYGGGIVNFLKEAPQISAPIMFHFGELDKGIPMNEVDQIRETMKSKQDATVFTYPGADHGFHCDERGSFNPAAAKQAWERTQEFFKKNLG